MAIIKSPVWSEARGSIGGTTYARNKAGLYARNRSKPVNPNTVNQSRVRSQFQTTAYGFSRLNIAQVLAWNQFAQGYPAINKVGDTYTPSGRQVYMLCNQNLQSIGETPIAEPPYAVPIIPDLIIPPDPFTLENAAGLVSNFVAQNFSSSLNSAVVIIQTTPNMQASRQSYRNRMRQLAFNGAGTDIPLTDAFNAYFGNPLITAGQIINVRASAVDPATGVASAWQYLQAAIPAVAP